MKDQRGSVTVMSLAMLLFLMVVAVAWLPMMTMEKTAAASDYREQQAWNAAEAGYKKSCGCVIKQKIMTGDGLHRKNIFEIVIVRILRI